MKRLTGYLPGLLGVLALSACHVQNISGTIMDKETKLPLDSAYVQNTARPRQHTYTNIEGNFTIKNRYIGLHKRSEMSITIMKKKHLGLTIGVASGEHKDIYLEEVY